MVTKDGGSDAMSATSRDGKSPDPELSATGSARSSQMPLNDSGSSNLSPLVRSLQGRLERAEEQIRRAREREKSLRDRLESDDMSQLLSAQRAQAEALRRENDGLRDNLREAQTERESRELTIRKLQQQQNESMKEAGEATAQLSAANSRVREIQEEMFRMQTSLQDREENVRRQAEELSRDSENTRAEVESAFRRAEKAEGLADERLDTIQDLESNVRTLAKQLEAASSDLDLATDNEAHRQSEVDDVFRENNLLRREVEELRAELEEAEARQLDLQEQLRAEQKAATREISVLRKCMVSEEVVQRLKTEAEKDLLLIAEEAEQLKKAKDEVEEGSRAKQRKIDELERELEDAGSMWRSAAGDSEFLRGRNRELEETARKVARLRDDLEARDSALEEMTNRLKVASLEAEVLEKKLQQSHADNQNTQQRLQDLLSTHVPKSAVSKQREVSEAELHSRAGTVAELRKDLALAHDDLRVLSAEKVKHSNQRIELLGLLKDAMAEMEANLTEIDHVKAVHTKDWDHDLQRSQDRNRELMRSLAQASFDLQNERTSSDNVQSKLQNLEGQRGRVEEFEKDAIELSIELSRAEDSAFSVEQKLKEVKRVVMVKEGLWEVSEDASEMIAKATSGRSNPKSPTRNVFLELERADQLYGTATEKVLKKRQAAELGAHKDRIKVLEEELERTRQNSIPLSEYNMMTSQLANECENIRQIAEKDLAVRFIHQENVITTLRGENRDLESALTTTQTQAEEYLKLFQKAKTAVETLQEDRNNLKTSGSQQLEILSTKVQALQQDLETSNQLAVELEEERDRLLDSLKDLNVQLRFREKEQAELEAELTASEDDIAKLKSALRIATDNIRKATERQKQEQGGQEAEGPGNSDMLARHLAQAERDNQDLLLQLNECQLRETKALSLLKESRSREGLAAKTIATLKSDAQAESLVAFNQVANPGLQPQEQRVKVFTEKNREELRRLVAVGSRAEGLAHSVILEVAKMHDEVKAVMEVWTLPQEQILQERARSRDEIIRLQTQIAEHTRHVQQVNENAERRIQEGLKAAAQGLGSRGSGVKETATFKVPEFQASPQQILPPDEAEESPLNLSARFGVEQPWDVDMKKAVEGYGSDSDADELPAPQRSFSRSPQEPAGSHNIRSSYPSAPQAAAPRFQPSQTRTENDDEDDYVSAKKATPRRSIGRAPGTPNWISVAQPLNPKKGLGTPPLHPKPPAPQAAYGPQGGFNHQRVTGADLESKLFMP